MKHKIGIICAAESELKPFLANIKHCSVTQTAMLQIYEGILEGIETAMLFSGVCKVNAAIAAQILIDHFQTDIIINSGAAGGINPALRIGDTVITTETAYHDVAESILKEYHPYMESVLFPMDKALLAYAKTAEKKNCFPQKIYYGRTVTGEAFIKDNHRNDLIEKYHPLTVDMETAAIAHVCYVNNVPFIAVRTVTDTAEHSGEENFEANCASASEASKNVVMAILREISESENPGAS